MRIAKISLLFILTLIIISSIWLWLRDDNPGMFSGERAYRDVIAQMEFGPRPPGSEAHAKTAEWIRATVEEAGWEVEFRDSVILDTPVRNIVARRGSGTPWIILGAHYDTRFFADQDPDPNKWTMPVPGANDGASGVAVLTELARVLPDNLEMTIWLVFFDAEDNGNIPGWDWILGSQAFVSELEEKPDGVVIVDMIGDADLNVYMEKNSNPDMMVEIWSQAARLGYGDKIIASPKYSMLDDHTPFLKAGIPAVDMIDFDYPYWHTTEDTADKVAPESLQVIGETLYAWLLSK